MKRPALRTDDDIARYLAGLKKWPETLDLSLEEWSALRESRLCFGSGADAWPVSAYGIPIVPAELKGETPFGPAGEDARATGRSKLTAG